MEEKKFWKGYICGFLSVVAIIALMAVIKRLTLPESLTLGQEAQVVLKLNQMSSLIGAHYLDEVQTEDLLEGAYAGFANAVGDKYTRYYTREEYEAYLQDASGTFAGIGVTIQWNEEAQMLEIISVQEEGPAERAGMHVGDLVYSVDDEVMKGTAMDLVTSKIRGKAGTEVRIGVLRDGSADPIVLTITRELIEEKTVNSIMLDGGIAYIEVSGFNEVTAKQFKETVESLKEQKMRGLILDLRGNPGGRLNSVVDVADQILPEGLITYTLTKDGQREEYTSDGETVLDIPMVVLIDENTASAAEILSGAIKDHERGVLVGTQTFGKGIVQTTYTLSDGSGIKVTMARYYTPNGDFIHGVGIEPDRKVELPEEKLLEEVRGTQDDTQYTAALQEMQKLLQD